MNDLILDLAVIMSGFLTNPHLTQEERDRGYEAGARLRAVANKEQEIRDKKMDRMQNFFEKGK